MSSSTFRTEIRLKPSDWKITYPNKFFCVGSCFAEQIHIKLKKAGFSSLCNPCGIVYNPVSMSYQILKCIQNLPWHESDLIFHNGLYHGLHHHGLFSSPDAGAVLHKMNAFRALAHLQLNSSDVLLLTLGSSITYRYKPERQIVANCHKIPADRFDRTFLTIDEILQAFDSWLPAIQSIRPALRIILTISPVRYLKEGFVDNSLSKSILVLAIQQLIKQYKCVYYFPAYEILLDDLRDYRFYKEDMIHPNDQAIEYLWSKFLSCYFNTGTLKILHDVNDLQEARMHRPLHQDTPIHRDFVKGLEEKILNMKRKYPFIELG